MTSRQFSFALAAAFIFAVSPSLAFADAATSTPDTTPPVITEPADQMFATTTLPAYPTLVPASATDDSDPSPVITYDPHLFALGTTTVIWTATDASNNFATTTSLVIITDATPPAPPPAPQRSVTVTIRDGVHEFTGTTTLADASDPPILVSPTGATSTIDVPADSLLATILTLDATTTDFDITDLGYYSSYDSFILNCLEFSGSSPECYNWTYAVNGSFPQVGINATALHDGDIVHIFFGSPRKTDVSTSTVEAGRSFTATALSYDLDSGTYVPALGLTLGVGTANPDFTFTELATSTSDSNGEAIFTLNATGTYSVGIQEDFYFPAATITITDISASTTATSTPSEPQQSGGGGGGGGGQLHPVFNMQNALAYLASKQQADGSFNDPAFTDWVAIAYGAVDGGASETALKAYLQNATPTMTNDTDYERHAMALEALGIDPYNPSTSLGTSGMPVDYITPIVNSFDGTQFGDPVVQDDIFAFFALLHAGYAPSDPMLHESAAYIISKQQVDGSWGDPDTTAAAVLALSTLFGPSGFDQRSLGTSVGKAAGFILSTENANGSWGPSPNGSIDSTSWMQTMINAGKESDPAHTPDYLGAAGFLPSDYIAYSQQSDGAVRPTTDAVGIRVWSTSYAIMAASGRSWITALANFQKPAAPAQTTGGGGGGGGGGIVLGASTSTVATSTLDALTSTSTPTDTTSTTLVSTLHPQIVATSTVANSDSAVQISKSIAHPKVLTPKIKKVAPNALAPSAKVETSQTAAAALPPQPGFLSKVWHAVVSFFSHLF